MDPKALKGMLERLGIKSRSIASTRVLIECGDRDIVIEEPEVTLIEGQGMRTFQITGRITEVGKAAAEVSDEDVKFVQEQTGKDEALVRKTLEETGGDMAEAIIRLKKERG
jgi:nascent polypeptide-associated complex subunit alpha